MHAGGATTRQQGLQPCSKHPLTVGGCRHLYAACHQPAAASVGSRGRSVESGERAQVLAGGAPGRAAAGGGAGSPHATQEALPPAARLPSPPGVPLTSCGGWQSKVLECPPLSWANPRRRRGTRRQHAAGRHDCCCAGYQAEGSCRAVTTAKGGGVLLLRPGPDRAGVCAQRSGSGSTNNCGQAGWLMQSESSWWRPPRLTPQGAVMSYSAASADLCACNRPLAIWWGADRGLSKAANAAAAWETSGN